MTPNLNATPSSIPNSQFKSIISNPKLLNASNSSNNVISKPQISSRPYIMHKLEQKVPAVESKSTQSNLETYVK